MIRNLWVEVAGRALERFAVVVNSGGEAIAAFASLVFLLLMIVPLAVVSLCGFFEAKLQKEEVA